MKRGNTFLANYNFIRGKKHIADITISLQPNIFLNYNILQTIPGSVSQSTEVDTIENLANRFSIFTKV